jgi:hypothetical protein
VEQSKSELKERDGKHGKIDVYERANTGKTNMLISTIWKASAQSRAMSALSDSHSTVDLQDDLPQQSEHELEWIPPPSNLLSWPSLSAKSAK